MQVQRHQPGRHAEEPATLSQPQQVAAPGRSGRVVGTGVCIEQRNPLHPLRGLRQHLERDIAAHRQRHQ